MFQVSGLSVNCLFSYANFTLGPDDPRAASVDHVRGSFLVAAYLKALVGENQYAQFEYTTENPFRVHTPSLRFCRPASLAPPLSFRSQLTASSSPPLFLLPFMAPFSAVFCVYTAPLSLFCPLNQHPARCTVPARHADRFLLRTRPSSRFTSR